MKRFLFATLAIVCLAYWLLGPSIAQAVERPDAWITAKVKMKLIAATDVPAMSINVDTSDGRVFLHGRVPNEQQRQRIGEIARSTEGVVAVDNALIVSPRPAGELAASEPGLSDADIKSRVQTALEGDPWVKNTDIKVKSVDDGIVELGGKADTITERLRAMELARSIPGVQAVRPDFSGPESTRYSDLSREDWPTFWRDPRRDVTSPLNRRFTGQEMAGGTRSRLPGEDTLFPPELPEAVRELNEQQIAGDAPRDLSMSSDGWITTDVKTKLLADNDVPGMQINVDTRDGVVTLFGTVPSEEAKRAAEADARKVEAVRTVRNELQVVPRSMQARATRDDQEIQREISKRLDDLEGANISTAVQAGVVRLFGTVDSSNDHLQALRDVRSTPGVRSVIDDVQVERN